MNPAKFAAFALFAAIMFGAWFGAHRYVDAFGHAGIYAAAAVALPFVVFGLWWEYRATKAVPWFPVFWLAFTVVGITWWSVG